MVGKDINCNLNIFPGSLPFVDLRFSLWFSGAKFIELPALGTSIARPRNLEELDSEQARCPRDWLLYWTDVLVKKEGDKRRRQPRSAPFPYCTDVSFSLDHTYEVALDKLHCQPRRNNKLSLLSVLAFLWGGRPEQFHPIEITGTRKNFAPSPGTDMQSYLN